MTTKNREDKLAGLELVKAQLQYWRKYDWDNFNKDTFNWEEDSWAVAAHAPHLIYKDLYNWEKFSADIVECAPYYFDKERFNWKKCSSVIFEQCPQLFDAERFNYHDNRFLGMLYGEPDSLNLKPISSRELIKVSKMDNPLAYYAKLELARRI